MYLPQNRLKSYTFNYENEWKKAKGNTISKLLPKGMTRELYESKTYDALVEVNALVHVILEIQNLSGFMELSY